jgi:hypothetical protein
MYLQKVISKQQKNIFVGILKVTVTEEKRRIRIWIRNKMSRIRNRRFFGCKDIIIGLEGGSLELRTNGGKEEAHHSV